MSTDDTTRRTTHDAADTHPGRGGNPASRAEIDREITTAPTVPAAEAAAGEPVPQAAHNERRERLFSLGTMALFDIGLSIGAFDVARAHGASEVTAYVLSMVGPLISLLIEFARHRRLSHFSLFILAIQVIALLTTFIGSTDPKILLLKDSVMTGGLGLVFLGTTLFAKPVTFYLGQKFATDGSNDVAAQWDEWWDAYPAFRRTQRTVGFVWGISYLIEAAIRVVLVYTVSFDVAFNIGGLLPTVITIAVVAWTFWFGMQARKQGERRRAALEAQQAAAARG